MRTPSLYPQIEKDLKRIARRLFADEDNFLEQKWRDVKDHIRELADDCERAAQEERQRDTTGD